MKHTPRKPVFHLCELETQTKYEENGIVRTWPCSWELEDAPVIPLDKGPITIAGKLTVDENGTSIFCPYRSTKTHRYMQVYTFGNSTVKLTKRHIIVTSRLERSGSVENEIEEYQEALKKVDQFMKKQLKVIFDQ